MLACSSSINEASSLTARFSTACATVFIPGMTTETAGASRTKRNAAWARALRVTKNALFSQPGLQGEEFWPFRAHVTLAKRGRSGVFAGQHAIGEGLADNQAISCSWANEKRSSRGPDAENYKPPE